MLPLKSMIIQKINPISWANLAALATAIFMVILILLTLIFGGIGGIAMLEGADADMLLEVIGGGAIGVIIAVIFIPLFLGALTWVYTVIFALIINLSLKLIGGLKIEVSE